MKVFYNITECTVGELVQGFVDHFGAMQIKQENKIFTFLIYSGT